MFRSVALAVAALIMLPLHAQQPADTTRRTAARAPKNPMQEGLPLVPTRTTTFTTRVGSWMSLNVSPDGRTIV